MLSKRIYNDYLEALKAKDRQKIDFLSLIRSELKNRAIDLKKETLDDEETLSVLKREQKHLKEAKESISSSNRDDLLQNLEYELSILKGYLPEPLGEDELTKIITEAISNLGASSMKDMGKVMKEVLAKVGAKADSKDVSLIVKNRLSPH